MSKRGGKAGKISYIRPDPPFLRRIREQIGYQEPATVDTKLQTLDTVSDRDYDDQDGESPTYVVTKQSNVSQEEADQFIDNQLKEKPQKIVFKKPTKKLEEKVDEQINKSKASNIQKVSNPLKRTSNNLEEDKNKEQNKPKKKQASNNNRLLSFNDEDSQEDDE